MLHILVDGDMIIFKAAVNAEVPINWWGDFWTLHADAAEAKAEVDDMIVSLVDKVLNHYNYEGKYKLVLCFTDPKDNFRKHILPTYKSMPSFKFNVVPLLIIQIRHLIANLIQVLNRTIPQKPLNLRFSAVCHNYHTIPGHGL